MHRRHLYPHNIDEMIRNGASLDPKIVETKSSLLEYLIKYPQVKMQFSTFLLCLMPLRVRQCPISSSPTVQRRSCTIIYIAVKGSGSGSGQPFEDASTTFLSTLKPGDNIQVALKLTATAKSKCPFHLPTDNSVPILMFCAGNGLCFFPRFHSTARLHARGQQKPSLVPGILIVGCRSYTQDRLCAEELDWRAEMGAVNIRYAFSQEPDKSLGYEHISDRLLHDRKDVVKIWRQGARADVCGSRSVLEAIGRCYKGNIRIQRKEWY